MSSPEIVLLQKEKAKAIEECDFQKAKSIDVHIKRLTAQIQYNDQTKKRIGNELLYESEKELVKREASKLFSEAYEELYAVKARFQERFSALHKLHAQQLKIHAESYSCDLEICSTRNVPDAMHLKKEAQTMAKNGGFDEADAIFKESRQVLEKVVAEREEEVHKVYALKTEQIQKKQEEENNLCKEKERIALNEVVNKYSANIAKLKKRLAATAQKLQIQQNYEEEELFFEELHIEEDILNLTTPPQTPQTSANNSTNINRSKRSSGYNSPSKTMSPMGPASPSTRTRREQYLTRSSPIKKRPMKMSPSVSST
ncbi:hypothetical protein M9Y10_016969 [Tritrichomonas musculus]|uniref:Uncharacterized protein n=1 Tax=Tritrichomonas musculus TaxID=1915356 RepID=A0ABR2HXP5_9EUKA